ncbi:hypothetical protein FVEN_g8054 [Fusarium venenatum]|uniref:Ubiquitin 3 binding protein But2 C-terminal domain-containing protein n=1 Tax=Fusarium venenatum TaxID=56646 RepID=A0A2L2TIU7_9HYPO|nr:uncharacterized protein FVRRES_04596 [Fusarium venenatum]KAG8353818.1 hypothetical protein FVEN_g8054 [Fusarium venenatum]KAH6991753.1 hypothetical protein EDB82DRAFT_534958 [Fusarium venenatum]CEI60160.1 unnamed protein product [Fusarium venenatum]
MHFSILLSLAVGLSGLDIVAASVCKPKPSESGSSSAESVSTSGTSSLIFSSASSTIFASTTTEAITTEGTTIAEPTTTLEATETETATTEASSTKTIATSSMISGSLGLPTTTQMTAVPSSTVLPLFRVYAQGGPTDDLPLLADRNGYAILLYDNSQGHFTDAFFAVDPVTHYLMLDNEQPICGYFGDNNGLANLVRCETGPTTEEVKIECQVPKATGESLACSVAALVCDPNCMANGETWTSMYTDTWGGDVRFSANLGSDSVDGKSKVPLRIEFLT